MNKFIDCLLQLDVELTHAYRAFDKLNLRRGPLESMGEFMNIENRPNIIHIMRKVADLDGVNELSKYYILEGVGCDLGELALHLGFIKKERVRAYCDGS
tara:strand:- start:178 stop:474 length:297 start_codon:yes stop_codon:yes gene_type:complete